MITIAYPIVSEHQNRSGLVDTVRNNREVVSEVLVLEGDHASAGEAIAQELQSFDIPARRLCGKGRNLSALHNRAYGEARSQYIAFLLPGIRVIPGRLKRFADLLADDPKTAWAYSDYAGPDQALHKLLDDIQDITEQFDPGHLQVYRIEALNRLNGWNEKYDHAGDYDLRLRAYDHFHLAHIPEVLYEVTPDSEQSEQVQIGASELCLPGSEGLGVFAYLFMTPEREREVEETAAEFLKRRGAYLTHENWEVAKKPHPKEEPLVTVLIPCRNRERFIGAAIESALGQTFRDFEIVVVDNASTDGTRDVVRGFKERVRLVENPAGSISFALNTGVRNARGRYISQLDSDDLYLPHTLEKMVAQLESNPKCALAISYYDLIDADGNRLKDFGTIKHLEYSRNNIMRVNGAGAVRTWVKSVLEEMGLFDEGEIANYGEDYDMVLKIGEKYDIDRVHDVCYLYRRHGQTTDASRDPGENLRLKTMIRYRAIERRRQFNERMAGQRGAFRVT